MFRELVPKGVKVPDGFAITAQGYWYFLRQTGLDQSIAAELRNLDTNDVKQLQRTGAAIRETVLAAKLPIRFARPDFGALTISYAGVRIGQFPLLSAAARQRKICPKPASRAPRKPS